MFRIKWEYFIQTIRTSPSVPDEDFLDRQGEKGWELIHVDHSCMIFKRKLRWWR